jgi:MYXO-CTERM domain-containing protein
LSRWHSLVGIGSVAALVAAAAPARAQTATGTAGTSGTTITGGLADTDFFIAIQHEQGINLSTTFDLPRFFNKARCDCSEPVYVYVTLSQSGFAKKSTISQTGTIEFWVGTGCNQILLQQQGKCIKLKTEPLSTFLAQGRETIATDARTMSTDTSTGTATTTVVTGTFTPTATCTANSDPFTQTVWVLVDYGSDQTYDVSATAPVNINLTPPPTPVVGMGDVAGGNEALVINWQGVDSALYPDLLGYQILCERGDNLQVFAKGTFSPSFQSCETTRMGTGPAALDPDYVCSPLLAATTSSYRVKILQNGIPYGATVVAIDKSGNASAPDVWYGNPTKTLSFYDVYRRGEPPQGGAEGGFCGVAPGSRPRAGTALALGVLAALAFVRRRRRRP